MSAFVYEIFLFYFSDTEGIYSIAFEEFLAPYGKAYPFEVKQKLMGKSTLEACQTLIDELELPNITAEECLKELEKRLDLFFPGTTFLPGVEKLILHLFKNKIPIAVCTGSKTSHYDLKTKNHKEIFK